jgi:hypothetical protein
LRRADNHLLKPHHLISVVLNVRFRLTCLEEENIMKSYRLWIVYTLILSFAIGFASCGGSSVQNPIQDSDEETVAPTQAQQNGSLGVKVNVSRDTVRAGETVQMTATVEPVQGTRIMLDWINVTKRGTLSVTNQNSATWTAPQTLDVVDVQVEVIQLVVTAIVQVVSVKETGVDTGTQILTVTKTILLTITP